MPLFLEQTTPISSIPAVMPAGSAGVMLVPLAAAPSVPDAPNTGTPIEHHHGVVGGTLKSPIITLICGHVGRLRRCEPTSPKANFAKITIGITLSTAAHHRYRATSG